MNTNLVLVSFNVDYKCTNSYVISARLIESRVTLTSARFRTKFWTIPKSAG